MMSNFASGSSRNHHRNPRQYQSQSGISTKQLYSTKQSSQQHTIHSRIQPNSNYRHTIHSSIPKNSYHEYEPPPSDALSSTNDTLLTIDRSLPESRDRHENDQSNGTHNGRPHGQHHISGHRSRSRHHLTSSPMAHIDNHPSPRISKSANRYELLIDQKRLHQAVKATAYPYLKWHWFSNQWEPVIEVTAHKGHGPEVLRLDGKTYPKCIPCLRNNMDNELFDESTVCTLIQWCLKLFVAYCAEYHHECTFVKKAKQYKDKLQQSLQQSKSLLHEKMKLEQEHDALLRQMSTMTAPPAIMVHDEEESNAKMESMMEDLKAYKESSKHWKREYHREKKAVTNTTRDFQQLLQKSNASQLELVTLNQKVVNLEETIDELRKANLVQQEQLHSVRDKLSQSKSDGMEMERKIQDYEQRNHQLVELNGL